MDDQTTKARILDRAYQLAGLYGLESLTIGGLAGELAMSKAGVYGHFGSKQALQLETVRYARAKFLQDVITPAGAAPDGVPRLWAMCAAVLSYSAETGLHGGDFWVTVFHEYAYRSGPVRDAVEATMNWWMRQLEDLISAASPSDSSPPANPRSSPSRSRRCSAQAAINTGSGATRRPSPARGRRSGSAWKAYARPGSRRWPRHHRQPQAAMANRPQAASLVSEQDQGHRNRNSGADPGFAAAGRGGGSW